MRILVVEDEEITAAVICGTLTSMGHQVTLAKDGMDAWRRLQDEHFPLLLTDWMMPGLDGPSLCRQIRARGDSPYTYVIFVSARDRRADLMVGLRAGADDFLVKPVEAAELAVRLEIAHRIIMVRENLEGQNARLARLAATDELTGLANRREFRRGIEETFALSQSQGLPLSLILLDVDQFKRFNDAYGHLAGDEALGTFAEVLRATCREHELAARYGGEEFAVVLQEASSEEARGCAERIRAALRDRPWPHRPLTASFGIATSGPIGARFAAGVADLVEQTDAALYYSKQQGRDRITLRDEMPDRRLPPEKPKAQSLGFISS